MLAQLKLSESISVNEDALTPSGTRSDWTFHKVSISSWKSLNRSKSSLAIVASLFAEEIPPLRKQFTTASMDTEFQAKTSICIPFKIEIIYRALFFTKLLMVFGTIFLQYLAFRDLIKPWFIRYVVDVVFGGKK